jgi:hypothetical protein
LGNDRIQFDQEDVGFDIGDQLAARAWPGVFAGGIQIERTSHVTLPDGRDLITFIFNNNSMINIVGKFEVRFKIPDHNSERDLKVYGEQLMLGAGE